MGSVKLAVLGIVDKFHGKDREHEVRSDQDCFKRQEPGGEIFAFLSWCAQHHVNFSDIYVIEDGELFDYFNTSTN